MFIGFVEALRRGRDPRLLKEHLLLEALDAEVIAAEPEQFYYLGATFVHDESQLDRFDRVFGEGLGLVGQRREIGAHIPEEWLRLVAEAYLTPEQMEAIKSLGSWEEIMQALKERLAEQQGRHQGGNKWIGTGGTSAFRPWRLQPRRSPDRRTGSARPGDQGVGEARISRPRR